MEGGFRTSNDNAHSCIPHGSGKSAENKSLRLTALLPKKIGKIEVRQLVEGEAMEKPYFVLAKDQIFSPLQRKRKGCRRKKRSRLPPPWCLSTGKAASSTGCRWFWSFCGCPAHAWRVDFNSCSCSPCCETKLSPLKCDTSWTCLHVWM